MVERSQSVVRSGREWPGRQATARRGAEKTRQQRRGEGEEKEKEKEKKKEKEKEKEKDTKGERSGVVGDCVGFSLVSMVFSRLVSSRLVLSRLVSCCLD